MRVLAVATSASTGGRGEQRRRNNTGPHTRYHFPSSKNITHTSKHVYTGPHRRNLSAVDASRAPVVPTYLNDYHLDGSMPVVTIQQYNSLHFDEQSKKDNVQVSCQGKGQPSYLRRELP